MHMSFDGRRSRVYDFAARRLLRRFYRRLADDIAAVAPQGSAVLDVGTGPGVLLVELARRRPDLQLTGIDLLGIAKDAMFHAPKHSVNQVVSLVASNRSQLRCWAGLSAVSCRTRFMASGIFATS